MSFPISYGNCHLCSKQITSTTAALYVHRSRFFFAMITSERGLPKQIPVDADPDNEGLLGAVFCLECALTKNIEGLSAEAVRAIVSQMSRPTAISTAN